MIFDLIINVIALFVQVLLAPVSAVKFVIDIASSLSFLDSIFRIIAFLMPWNNILPLFVIVVALIGFRIAISIIQAMWRLTPFT